MPWKEIYKKGNTYDLFSKYEDSENILIREVINKITLNNKLILDLGAGSGKHSLEFSKYGKKICSVEPCKNLRKILVKKVKENHLNNIKIFSSRAEKLPFKRRLFDVIFSSWVLKATNLNLSILEIERVLKKNGKLFIIENSLNGEFMKLRKKYCDSNILNRQKDYLRNLRALLNKNFKVKEKKLELLLSCPNPALLAEVLQPILNEKIAIYIKNHLKRKIKMEVIFFECSFN